MNYMTRYSSFKSPYLKTSHSDELFSTLQERDGLSDFHVTKSDDQFFMSLGLPGLEKEDIEVHVEKRTLTIRGERKKSYSAEKIYRSEVPYGSFSHEFTIPENYDLRKTKVELKNGQLLIEIPRDPKTRARKIEIKCH